MRAVRPKKSIVSETQDVRRLQERIAELIVESDRTVKEKQVAYDELNDVVIYLNDTVEQQNYQIARLEDVVKSQSSEYNMKITEEREALTTQISQLNGDIEKCHAENILMKTQIDNEKRLEEALTEANAKLVEMDKELKERDMQITSQGTFQRQLVIQLTEKIRNELEAENEVERANARRTLHIQNTAEMKMSQEVIAQLEETIGVGQMEIAKLKDQLNEKEEELQNREAHVKFQEGEIERLRKHIERSSNQTEVALKDSKKRIEDIERSREEMITKHTQILKQLKKENADLSKELKGVTVKYEKLQDAFLEQKRLRELTVEAHANQNDKLEQLLSFLRKTIAEHGDDAYVDAILAENRTALFAKLSLLLQQIPTVK